MGCQNTIIPYSVTSIGFGAFIGCSGLTSIIIPDFVTGIGSEAFELCSELTTVDIGNSLKFIGSDAFWGCSRLVSINLPNTVTRIGDYAFFGCDGLTSINISNSVTRIGNSAFWGCSNLKSITIPKSVTYIGGSAFASCDSLNEVYSLINNPTDVTIEANVFKRDLNNYNNRKLFVPSGTSEIYQSITEWSQYFGIILEFEIIPVSSVELDKSMAEIIVGDNLQLIATVMPENATDKTIKWTSSDESVAIVNNNGLITAIAPGTTIITVATTDGSNLSASCSVTVKQLATSISLNETSATIYTGNSLQLIATVSPSTASNPSVTWTSSNTSVATVSSSGLVTAKSTGNATITARTVDGSNLSASCSVTVKQLATSISLNETSATVYTGNTLQLTATVLPSTTSNKSVTWTSSNPSVATVSSSGLVTAVSVGNATITAKTADGSNLSASCSVAVKQQATSISLSQTSATLYMGNSLQLTATVLPNNTTDKTVSWTSSNTDVAIVSSNGLVVPVSTGSAIITAKTADGSNLTAQCVVTVKQYATSISLSESDVTIYTGNTLQLTATVLPSTTSNPTVTWSSSNTSVATVSSTGLVTAKSTGNAVITAKTSDGTNLSATCNVTVKRLATSISLNKTSATLYLDQTVQLTATVSPSNATDKSVVWSSSDNSIATVSSTGLVTAISPGNATITAMTADGSDLSATCEITVKAYVTSITLNETSLVMHIGDTFQLTADIQPENASDQTLNWSTGNSSVASVDNNGLVTAIAGGTTYIQAKTRDGSSLTARCTIEVIPDYYITLDTLSHIRGEATRIVDLPVSLVNKNPISGIQFDVSLPNCVEFNLVDSMPDVWLDDARGTRSHSISASQLSNGKYRVLVTSATSRDLRGNDGVLVHMNMLLPQQHDTGNRYINITNIIASEADETRHTLDNKSTVVHFYYIVGDADANAVVDIADHAATASKILGRSPSPFYYDAANVDGNNSLDVADLVGITNIALEIRPITVRQVPRRGEDENLLFCDRLNLNAGGEREITLGIDCGFAFAGFQMDVELPNGLTLTGATLGDDASALGLATEMMPDGKIRILGTSFSDSEVDGNCPRLLTLKVKAERNYMPGSEIEFADILFAERDMTAHAFDGLCIEYIEPSSVYELTDDARIYVENGNIIVDTPIAGIVQLIAIDGRMIEYQAHVGHNIFVVDASGIYIINFNGKTLKVRL